MCAYFLKNEVDDHFSLLSLPPPPLSPPLMQAIDKNNAKRNIESVSRQYVNAKRSSQELEGISRGLIRGGTSVPLRGTPQEIQQV